MMSANRKDLKTPWGRRPATLPDYSDVFGCDSTPIVAQGHYQSERR